MEAKYLDKMIWFSVILGAVMNLSCGYTNILGEVREVEKDVKNIKQELKSLHARKDVESSGYLSKKDIDEEIRKKNEEILHNYLDVLPELVPDLFAVNYTNSKRKMLRLVRRKLKRRKHHFHKTCGRRYTVLEKWLEAQLQNVQKRAAKKYINNCTKIDAKNRKTGRDDIGKRGENHRYPSTTTLFCSDKGDYESDGSVTMCKECLVRTDLSERVFPRYIHEVTCGDAFNDNFCFSGEGMCVENYIYVTFLIDDNEVGMDRLCEWRKYQQAIRTSCSCQIMSTSFFRGFL
ncbi:uncharacterized protein LOC130646322 [Hydractinia symbiolongicarpus]|uniref:uncharacterized protein LOC130646322 n=1 Tax=Hydractinia symbiolongicarpus TaxID=13093 RepID=UPI002550C982|nr:uncharacterized protein LOC130646322 [Hydractinia symbiolongicarpus]